MKDSPRRLAAVLAIGLTTGLVGCSKNDAAEKIEYSLVTVGDPGNAADSTGFGAVGYTYRIGKYPVTVGEYTSFLNAVARADPNGLYEPNMGSDLNIAGISRSGEPGSYSYSVVNNNGDTSKRPIAYVSWFNAARFANWMDNGQPSGAQSPATTEDGAYPLRGATSGNAVARRTVNPVTGRAVGYWIPTEDEWYKAAYFSPNVDGSGRPGYYLYATQSNTAPGQTAGSTPNQANVMVGPNFSVTGSPTLVSTQNYLTDVGSFSASPSYYGTFDQNGNLYQWNDLDGNPFPYRGVRGSFWFATATAAQSIIYAGLTPSHTGNDIGFRLAASASESR
jgi:formylglycine-generating enzyme